MAMEMEAGMDTVLERFDLLLDRDGRGSNPCGSDRSSRSGAGSGGSAAGKEADGGAVKERIARALRIYKEAAEDHGDGVLVQVWALARDGARRVLATRGQPFVLAPPQCHRLFQYRTVSLTHAFPVGGPGAAAPGERGMPGRVFDAGTPEWTPNVQYYGSGEYARISYALIYDIQAALVLPILDPDTDACLAVFELVMTSPRLRFAAEVDKLCKALQAVALRGSDICCPVAEVSNDEEVELAMSEISGILTTVCEAQELPLAQAWVRCKRCNTSSTEHVSLTTAGAPCHLADEAVRGFREACVEQHLREGRGGLVEEAATARGPRFCADVTKYSMDEYPLAHHARFSGLAGCLAMCVELRSDAGREECVLEFFLPPDRRDGAAQKATAEAVAATIRERFSNGGDLKAVAICGIQDLAFEIVADDECALRPDDLAIMADTPELELDDLGGYERDSDEEDVHLAAAVGSADVETPKMNNDEQKEGEDPKSRVGRTRRKKKVGKRKNEKTVNLEELQRHFSGRMKDAARRLGVCPTTMKRICRQHGISRWPFRQIAKANNSLHKVKRIFESVQYSPTPPMDAPAASQQAPAPATAHHPPAGLPCQSSALGVASSQGSCCQEPTPRRSTTMRKPFHASNDKLVTVKASYRGDIVRFRVSSSAGVEAVKGEVAKRLSLEMNAFDVKYLDDDNEWVLLSCDGDFQECLEAIPALSVASSSSASAAAQPVVRLVVQEVDDSHGSSCESSD